MKKSQKKVHGRDVEKTLQARMQKVLQSVADGIAEHGWYAIAVGSDGPANPGFTYTVGMQHSFEAPEVVIVGLDMDTAKSYLNHAADLAREKKPMRAGHMPGLFGEFDGWALKVSEAEFEQRCKISRTLYPGKNEAIQLVFPDPQGRFPWDPASVYFGKVPVLGPAPVMQ